MAEDPRADMNWHLGRLEGRMEALEGQIRPMADDVKRLVATMNQTKGGWKLIVSVGAIAGSIGALVGPLAAKLGIPWK